MSEFDLKVEIKELPIGMLSENTGQIAKRYLKGYIEAVEKYGTE